jgi:Protein of unknown function (DUF1761)
MGFLQAGAVNYVAVVVAAVVGWLIGMAWYMALGRRWAAANNITIDAEKSRRPPIGLLVTSFVALLVMAWVLSGILFHLGPGKLTVRNGMISGAWIWLGFVITTMVVNNGFAGRRPVLLAIDGGHWLVVLLAIGAILGALG